MSRSATDIMQDIVAAAVIDGIVALKAASKGLPNSLLRDVGAIHANTTLADLPPELQAAIASSVRAAFSRLLKEGYSVSPAQSAPPRGTSPPRHDSRRDRPSGPRPPAQPRGPREPGGRPPRGPGGGGRPGGGRPGKPRGSGGGG